jgi:hypothetical protein
LLRCYLDYMWGCIPHIHTHPNFPHYAFTKINIKYYIKDYEHIATTSRELRIVQVLFIFIIQNKWKGCNLCWEKIVKDQVVITMCA